MPREIDDIVDDSIEEMGVDAVIEQQAESSKKKPQWENWTALASSVLAVVSAIAALLATFAADEAAIAESARTTYAAYHEGTQASYHVLMSKLDMLSALGKEPSKDDLAILEEMKQRDLINKEKAKEAYKESEAKYRTHDKLAIAVTFFQVSILLGGLAVLVQRRALWLFGLTFSIVGFGFMASGLIGA